MILIQENQKFRVWIDEFLRRQGDTQIKDHHMNSPTIYTISNVCGFLSAGRFKRNVVSNFSIGEPLAKWIVIGISNPPQPTSLTRYGGFLKTFQRICMLG